MNVAVVGSLTPWIEAILINLNNNVTTIDRKYKFTIGVQDQYAYSKITREFTVGISISK